MIYDTTYFDSFIEEANELVFDIQTYNTEREYSLEKLFHILYEGYIHKDPTIYYLVGLYYFQDADSISADIKEIWESVFGKESKSFKELFIESAKLGLEQAKLLCAYLYTLGKFGFNQDFHESDMLLKSIETRPFSSKIEDLQKLIYESDLAKDEFDTNNLMECYGEILEEYSPLTKISQQISNLLYCLTPHFKEFYDIDYGFNFQWVYEMNLFESFTESNYTPPVIPEREENTSLAISLNEEGLQADVHKDYEKSKNCYLEALSYKPNEPTLYFNLGYSYLMLKQKEAALWAFQKAGDLKNPLAYSMIGRIYAPTLFSKLEVSEKDDYNRALLYFSQAIDLFTDSENIGKHLYWMALIFIEKNNSRIKPTLYAWVSSRYGSLEASNLYNQLKSKLTEEEILEIESIKDWASLKQKDNLYQTFSRDGVYKRLFCTYLPLDFRQLVNVKLDPEPFQHFISIYNDTEELEKITREIFFEGKPAHAFVCEYCDMVIDFHQVKVRSNFFGQKSAALVSTISWLLFLVQYNSKKTAIKLSSKQINETIRSLEEKENERRGLLQICSIYDLYYPRRYKYK